MPDRPLDPGDLAYDDEQAYAAAHSLPEDGEPRPPLTEVDLTAAAIWVLGLRDDPLLQSCYRGALGTWAMMLAMDDEQALAHAETLAAAARPVRAAVPPF